MLGRCNGDDFFNIFIPHLLGTFITASPAPGAISGLVLNAPVISYLLWRGLKEKTYEIKSLIISSLVISILAIPLLFILFFLGSFVENMFWNYQLILLQ